MVTSPEILFDAPELILDMGLVQQISGLVYAEFPLYRTRWVPEGITYYLGERRPLLIGIVDISGVLVTPPSDADVVVTKPDLTVVSPITLNIESEIAEPEQIVGTDYTFTMVGTYKVKFSIVMEDQIVDHEQTLYVNA